MPTKRTTEEKRERAAARKQRRIANRGSKSGSGPDANTPAADPAIGAFDLTMIAEREYSLVIDGAIGGPTGVTAAQISQALQQVPEGPDVKLNITIHSGGGSVFEAAAIYSALVAHEAYITMTVVGVAASAATLILQAADCLLYTSDAADEVVPV